MVTKILMFNIFTCANFRFKIAFVLPNFLVH